jgi:hypothetical protein
LGDGNSVQINFKNFGPFRNFGSAGNFLKGSTLREREIRREPTQRVLDAANALITAAFLMSRSVSFVPRTLLSWPMSVRSPPLQRLLSLVMLSRSTTLL